MFLPCSSSFFCENRALGAHKSLEIVYRGEAFRLSWIMGSRDPLLQLAQDTGVPVILDKEVTLERKKSPSSVLGQHSPPSSPANTKKLSLIFDFSWEFWAFSLASQLSAVKQA